MSKRFNIILTVFLILGSLYFLFMGLSKGKGFLIPLTTAIILAMVMNPVVRKLSSWGVGRGLAVFFADLVIVLFLAGMAFLFFAQANKIANNWPKIQERVKPKVEQAKKFINNTLNISIMESGGKQDPGSQSSGGDPSKQGKKQSSDDQKQSGENQQPEDKKQKEEQSMLSMSGENGGEQSGSGGLGFPNVQSLLGGVLKNVFGFLTDMLLILVYIFFFMYYKKKLQEGIIGLVPENKREEARRIIHQSTRTAQQYLLGRFLLILILAGLYMVGYALAGLKYAVFLAFIGALFSLLPYIGNVVAVILAIGMSVLSGGGTGQIIAIAVIFSVVQFVESYILEPFVVGGKVDLNPVVVIVGVVLGGIVWGLMGMLLAIPILGIIKVIFDHVDALKPFGYMLDERDISSGDGAVTKIKSWFQEKFGH